ncbi:uncharacterized protein [Hyperolius riggenbachi]|uniref:uncharacterized protein n=1 Tax=Hyperolius riggenbachi TaxID=752182 RepID=UPI0035A2C314
MHSGPDSERAHTIGFATDVSQDWNIPSQQVTDVTAVPDIPPPRDLAVPACPISKDAEPAVPAATANNSFTFLALASLPFAEALDGFDGQSPPPTSDLAAPTAEITSPGQEFAILAFSELPFPLHLAGSAVAVTPPTDDPAALVTSSADQKFAILAFSVLPFAQHTDRHAEPAKAREKVRSGPHVPILLQTSVDGAEPSAPPAAEKTPHHVSRTSFCPPKKARRVTWAMDIHPEPEAFDAPFDPQKRTTITAEMRRAFYRLLGKRSIRDFLPHDGCRRVSDKYLLAMVLIYFSRAGHSFDEYTIRNFYTALYIANKMEEDMPFYRCIYEFAAPYFSSKDDFYEASWTFVARMGFWARVSRDECRQVMSRQFHRAWRRKRMAHHGVAIHASRLTRREKILMKPGRGYTCDQCLRSRSCLSCCILQ